MDQMKKYLRATYAIDCENEAIRKKAEEITGDTDNVTEKAGLLFYFVRDRIKYNPYLFTNVLDNYRASKVLEKGEGFCVQKAVLLTALARAADIPARLRFADILNHIVSGKMGEFNPKNLYPYHGYDDLFINGQWIKATPAFDIIMCEKNQIIPVEFDGLIDGTFHSHNLEGKLHIEYIRDHGHYDDLPFDSIIDANVEVYGSDYFERVMSYMRETG